MQLFLIGFLISVGIVLRISFDSPYRQKSAVASDLALYLQNHGITKMRNPRKAIRSQTSLPAQHQQRSTPQ